MEITLALLYFQDMHVDLKYCAFSCLMFDGIHVCVRICFGTCLYHVFSLVLVIQHLGIFGLSLVFTLCIPKIPAIGWVNYKFLASKDASITSYNCALFNLKGSLFHKHIVKSWSTLSKVYIAYPFLLRTILTPYWIHCIWCSSSE